VENSLDAAARHVEIAIRNGGKTEIRVADDGWGMGPEDALAALDRHATSKIREPKDLLAIRTLGFRGEALPAIASVSRLVLETAERDGQGTRMVVVGGRVQAVEGCARQRGTTVTVRTLFFNVPARAKFLRSAAAETRAVVEVVAALALGFPHVGFRLESNHAPLVEAPPAADTRSRIAALWGEELARELVPVAHRVGRWALSGWVQRPAAASAGRRRGHLFVGGRAVIDRSLLRAATRAYETTIPPGARPWMFLFLDLPPEDVDVNVHPTKAQVRFRDPAAVERLVYEGVRQALASLHSAAPLGEAVAPSPPLPPPPPTPARRTSTVRSSQTSLFVPTPATPEAASAVAAPARAQPSWDGARPHLWQVHATYIFVETHQGLLIVDQHSAHERVLYEDFLRAFEREPLAAQRLLLPLTLHLTPEEVRTAEACAGLFARLGYELEVFGPRTVLVRAVPCPHPYFDAERALRESLAELTYGSPLVDPARTQHQRVALSLACKAAIKAGQRLTTEEMHELFDRLFATELPYHDIHGRPTIVQLPLAELHHRFGRSG